MVRGGIRSESREGFCPKTREGEYIVKYDGMGRFVKTLRSVEAGESTRSSPRIPSRGIPGFNNTCFFNSAIMLIKQIPGLEFKTGIFERIYTTPPECISEDMVREALCRFPSMDYGRQHDSMEFVMGLCEDIINREKISVRCGIGFYLNKGDRKLPLLSRLNDTTVERINNTTESIWVTGLKNRVYYRVQDILEGMDFECDGYGIDYSDESEFHPLDFVVEESGIRTPLSELFREAGSKTLLSSTKPVFLPESEFVILNFHPFDPVTGRKLRFRIMDVRRNILFRTGRYTPISLVVHVGGINFGHYINYTLIGKDWFEFNDDSVRTVNFDSFQLETPYYILYKRV